MIIIILSPACHVGGGVFSSPMTLCHGLCFVRRRLTLIFCEDTPGGVVVHDAGRM